MKGTTGQTKTQFCRCVALCGGKVSILFSGRKYLTVWPGRGSLVLRRNCVNHLARQFYCKQKCVDVGVRVEGVFSTLNVDSLIYLSQTLIQVFYISCWKRILPNGRGSAAMSNIMRLKCSSRIQQKLWCLIHRHRYSRTKFRRYIGCRYFSTECHIRHNR